MHTIISRKLQDGKKRNGDLKEIEVPNPKKIRETYEKMNIFMVKKSGYGIEYLQKINCYEYLRLFEILKDIEK